MTSTIVFTNETVEQIYNEFADYLVDADEEPEDYLDENVESIDVEDIKEIKEEMFDVEFMDREVLENITDIEGVEKIGTMKCGVPPENYTEEDLRSAVTVYDIEGELLVDDDLYYEQYVTFMNEDILHFEEIEMWSRTHKDFIITPLEKPTESDSVEDFVEIDAEGIAEEAFEKFKSQVEVEVEE